MRKKKGTCVWELLENSKNAASSAPAIHHPVRGSFCSRGSWIIVQWWTRGHISTPGSIRHLMKLEQAHHTVFIVPVKVPFWTPSSPASLPADPTAPWGPAWCHRTLPGKWEYSLGNNSNCKSPRSTAENFLPSAFIFHLVHLSLLFHRENCCTNLWWSCVGSEGFLLTFPSCHLYVPLCTCQARCLKWPAEGGLWEQPRHPVQAPELQHFLNPKHYPVTPWSPTAFSLVSWLYAL